MAIVAGRKYTLKLERGSLYVQRRHVMGVIDHDTQSIIVSDEIPAGERIAFVDQLLAVASRGAKSRRPKLAFTAVPILS